MQMTHVNSSAMVAVGYDASRLQMKITFSKGNTYDFCRVPQQVFDGLLRASSKGSYYNDHIKDRYVC